MSMANEFEYGSPSETEEMRQEIQKLKQERSVLVEALIKLMSYETAHSVDCAFFCMGDDGNDLECDCGAERGMDQAREALKKIGEII